MKTLERIKLEVFATEIWTEHEDLDEVINEVAKRYANEQNMELVEMLKECMQVLSSVQSPATPAILLRREIESLINSNIPEL